MGNYLMLNDKKIALTDEQVREIEKSFGFNRTYLSDIAVGETFKIGDYEFIVLEHSEETTAIILKKLLIESIQFGEDNNDFRDSDCDVRRELEKFAIKIGAIVGEENLIEHEVDLTSDDGLDDYGVARVKMSLLTSELYRKYVRILDKHKLDAWWWLITPHSTPTHKNADWVKCVSPGGRFGYGYYFNFNRGVRPFCILKSNIFVSK